MTTIRAAVEALRTSREALPEHHRVPWHVHVAGTGIRSSEPYAFLTTTAPNQDGPILPIAERHNDGTVADMRYLALVASPHVVEALEQLLEAIDPDKTAIYDLLGNHPAAAWLHSAAEALADAITRRTA